MQRRHPPAAAGALLSVLLAAAAHGQGARAVDAPALFAEHCAACHGELGDGKGTTVLPRPARSFLEGGFSYGNTDAAILRSISHGIPGTPMPSFHQALTEEQRTALVHHVVSLGPPRDEVAPRDAVLTVGDVPLVVRGFLPAAAEGAPELPRGLLIGTPTGATFQYRADDVRLVAVRQGEFVERRDWVGRGGRPLEPLGSVAYLDGAGDPGPAFRRLGPDGPEDLRATLTGTWIQGRTAGLSYRLRDAKGATLATVRETPSTVHSSVGSGFRRRFELSCGSRPLALELDAVPDDAQATRAFVDNPVPRTGSDLQIQRRSIWLYAQPDGLYVMAHCTGPRAVTAYRHAVRLDLAAGATVDFRVSLVTAASPSREAIDTLAAELH